jgi:hypothetical protein
MALHTYGWRSDFPVLGFSFLASSVETVFIVKYFLLTSIHNTFKEYDDTSHHLAALLNSNLSPSNASCTLGFSKEDVAE